MKLGKYEEIVSQYFDCDTIDDIKSYGNGHINDTFLVTFRNGEKAIIQKINKYVFKQPEEVMENIVNVTAFLKEKICKNGGNPERETLTVYPTKKQKYFYKDSESEYWRAYKYIEDSVCYDESEHLNVYYECGKTCGRFHELLSDYPQEKLYETIKGFHDTKARFQVFQKAVEEDICHRAAKVQEEISFILDREDVVNVFTELVENDILPIRVTHNDTKLNNIMIDQINGKGLCMIDLDTVMPGFAMNDFGDAIRSGANNIKEDAKELGEGGLDLKRYEAYANGFLESCRGALTDSEIEYLPFGAKLMTFECGIRFLTDYLQGDIYYKTAYKEHNLVRCKTQLKLVENMEEKWEEMCSIIAKYR